MFDDTDHKANDDLREPYRPVRKILPPAGPPKMDAETEERWKILCLIALLVAAFMAWWLLQSSVS